MPIYKILVLPGDGVGPDVTAEAVKILQVVEMHTDAKFDFQYALFGGCSIDENGVAVTEETLEKARSSDAVLLGAVGGPKWYYCLFSFREGFFF